MKNDKINKNRLIKTFTDLAKIPSPSWGEEKVIRYIMNRLKILGVSGKKVKCLKSHNILAVAHGPLKKAAPILFSAHTDTVAPCHGIKPLIKRNKITSDGTTILGSDDKAAVAMFLEALEIIREHRMAHGRIEFLFSCAEEIGLFGAKNFDLSAIKAKKAFVFDSGGRVGRIIVQAPYHMTMEIFIRGRAAHAGMEPEKGINAIRVLSEIIVNIPAGRIDMDTTVNTGIISGGRATNIVPDEAFCKIEIRSMVKEKMKEMEQKVRASVKDISGKFGAKYRISGNMEYEGFSIKRDDGIVKISSEALENIGINPALHVSGGGSDTNIFNKNGIRAINLSCGMQKVHTTGEFILIKDLIDGTRLVLSLIDTVNRQSV